MTERAPVVRNQLTSDDVFRRFKRALIAIPLAFTVLWAAMPLVWAISASFKKPIDIYKIPPEVIPSDPTLANYQQILQDPATYRFLQNSLILTIGSTFVAVIIATVAAYGFARYAFRWRHALLLFILIPRLVPRVSLIVPIYQMAQSIGALNSFTFLIIVYSGTAIPLATWIMIGFIQAIPKELEEAARIDGASTWQVFRRVVVPLSIPGLLTIGVLTFREGWNEFPFVLALTTSREARTLPYQLFLMLGTEGIQNWPLVEAFAIISIVPIILLYLRFEKYVVAGLTQGAVK